YHRPLRQPDAAWSNLPQLVVAAKFPNMTLEATGVPATRAIPFRLISGGSMMRTTRGMFWGHRHHPHIVLVAQGVAMFTGGEAADHRARRRLAIAAEADGVRTMELETIKAGSLKMAYMVAGPSDGWPCVMCHGFPYDPHAFAEAAPRLAAAGA